MAASEFIAAAIAAFSVAPLSSATAPSDVSDMHCMPAPAFVRALDTGTTMRSDVPRLRIELVRGCAGGAPRGMLAALVEAIRNWVDSPGVTFAGIAIPRAAVSVMTLADPADHDPLQRMIRQTVAELRERDPMLDIDRRQLGCLQRALYFEARGEGTRGLAAVAYVALNRLGTRPNRISLCDVVQEPGQFAPYLSGEPDDADLAETDEDAVRLAVETAAQVMAGYLPDPSRGGRYFYAPAVLKSQPTWVKGMRETARVGGHRFFAEPEARIARSF
jgi:hypothetical protein